VLTHKFILREVWGTETDVQYLRIYIRTLRQKILEADPDRRSSSRRSRAWATACARRIEMRFGVFYELQLPRPWEKGDEQRLFHQALAQVALADKLGYDYAWEVEHHFLDEYSHSSAPEVFLAAAAAQTKTSGSATASAR
jgi:hypothetical protein